MAMTESRILVSIPRVFIVKIYASHVEFPWLLPEWSEDSHYLPPHTILL
jgi:hypothetical protein